MDSLAQSTIDRFILRMRVDATSYADATRRIVAWAAARRSCYVCVANVHMAMEVYDSPQFAAVVNQAALVTPDGMPLVWALRLFGAKQATRVYGPTLMLHLCAAAVRDNLSIGLYGGTEQSLADFVMFLQDRFPGIQIACQIAPPFRPITESEAIADTAEINRSGAQILFVGIGCPKQENWMAAQSGQINAVMLGVGAAFDFHSGRVKQAPNWMQKVGLEWLFRLVQEPRRLWKRYVYNNPRFIVFLLRQWLTGWIDRQLFGKKRLN
jgi:N-acetylglucosaminyldiphosphoundecaprenol N-acetyl-beta-D-mannosaminyltransferase